MARIFAGNGGRCGVVDGSLVSGARRCDRPAFTVRGVDPPQVVCRRHAALPLGRTPIALVVDYRPDGPVFFCARSPRGAQTALRRWRRRAHERRARRDEGTRERLRRLGLAFLPGGHGTIRVDGSRGLPPGAVPVPIPPPPSLPLVEFARKHLAVPQPPAPDPA